MKNTFKVLGIIALAAVIGFSFISCEETGTTTVKVVNEYAGNTITRVEIDLGPDSIDDASAGIVSGQNKTYSFTTASNASGTISIRIYINNSPSSRDSSNTCKWETGNTYTFTLSASGSGSISY
jgi:hypothetical protein